MRFHRPQRPLHARTFSCEERSAFVLTETARNLQSTYPVKSTWWTLRNAFRRVAFAEDASPHRFGNQGHNRGFDPIDRSLPNRFATSSLRAIVVFDDGERVPSRLARARGSIDPARLAPRASRRAANDATTIRATDFCSSNRPNEYPRRVRLTRGKLAHACIASTTLRWSSRNESRVSRPRDPLRCLASCLRGRCLPGRMHEQENISDASVAAPSMPRARNSRS